MREAPKVFISYSHDSREHSQRVLQLADTLRSQGVDVVLDQYEVRPVQGWPRWCEEQLRPENSAFVLAVCTDTYRRRIENKVAADEGRGVFWEGTAIYNYIYNEKENRRFIPILLSGACENDIPVPLQGSTRYRLAAFDLRDAGYNGLCRELTGQPLVTKPPLGGAVTLPPGAPTAPVIAAPLPARPSLSTFPIGPNRISPTKLRHGAEKLFGREKELRFLNGAWRSAVSGKTSRRHVITFVAWGGVGKTALIVNWINRLSAKGWPGVERYFDWSFYSQGTREQGNASSDTFVAAALKFFGDEAMANSPASGWDKGARLAELVAQQRTLLILDGLEPLQYPPGPLTGQLKDPAIEVLLRALAQRNPGLCVVTTRESVTDLVPFHETTAPEWSLEQLSDEAGAALLHQAGVRRAGAAEIAADDAELIAASGEFGGHALTLRVLAVFLHKAHGGDIRRRDRVELDEADPHYKTNVEDADKPYGHAFKTIRAYEKWLGESGEAGMRQLAILRLMALFDRPADAGCLAALRKEPAIEGLTDPLVGLSEEDWNVAVSGLGDCGLVSAHSPSPPGGEGRGEGVALDAHPLIREYFAHQLRKKGPDARRAGHRRLYEHLTQSTEHQPDTLAGLQPLYQAVAHGCQAGLHQAACNEVYYDRILRGSSAGGFYSSKELGAIGANLGAIACFFEEAWTRLSGNLTEGDQAWLLNEAAYYLRALGRLTEALEPMRVSMDMGLHRGEWNAATVSASNLSELGLTLGHIGDALRDAEHSVTYADRSNDAFWRMGARTTLADAQHQAGRRADALALFREAEAMQGERQRELPLLYSVQGFQYCDLLLSEVERAAWQVLLGHTSDVQHHDLLKACQGVEQRAAQTLEWAKASRVSLLSIALEHLTSGRVVFYRAMLAESKIQIPKSEIEPARGELDAAVDGLRRAGQQQEIPRALLSRASLRVLDGDASGAQADLDEAWRIAARGPMRLYMADIHLYRARLFGVSRKEGASGAHATAYPWPGGPRADLAAARKLIDECSYHRRDEELTDAERAIA